MRSRPKRRSGPTTRFAGHPSLHRGPRCQRRQDRVCVTVEPSTQEPSTAGGFGLWKKHLSRAAGVTTHAARAAAALRGSVKRSCLSMRSPGRRGGYRGRMRSWPSDSTVRRVEALLGVERLRRSEYELALSASFKLQWALWICACVTVGESPTWLIFETGRAKIAWCRLGDGEPIDQLIDALLSGGGHADPEEVLRWLRGTAPDPWGAGGERYR